MLERVEAGDRSNRFSGPGGCLAGCLSTKFVRSEMRRKMKCFLVEEVRCPGVHSHSGCTAG